MVNLRDNVERWLIHENYSFKEEKSVENNFKMLIKHTGSFGNIVEIFQPKNQSNVLVLGSNIPFKNNQNVKYLRLNESERAKFEKKVDDFCYSIKAVHKMSEENGKKVAGVFVVLDKEEQFNQNTFLESLQKVIEMSDQTSQFLIKAF